MTDAETARRLAILVAEGRRTANAYVLVMDGFNVARGQVGADVDGGDLLIGVVCAAVAQFGTLAPTVARRFDLDDAGAVTECVSDMARVGLLFFAPGETLAAFAASMAGMDFGAAMERRAGRFLAEFPPVIVAGARTR